MNTNKKLVFVKIRNINRTYTFEFFYTDTIKVLKDKVYNILVNDDLKQFIDFKLYELDVFRVQSKDFTQDNDLIVQYKHSDYFEFELIKKKSPVFTMTHCSL